MSTLKNLRRDSGRRYWTLGAALVTLVVFGVVFVAASGAGLASSPFEGADGNMIVDTAGHTDWCTDFPPPASGQTCAAPIPGLRTLVDVASGQNDNSFTGGSHEDDPNVSVATGSVPPNKNDLTRAYVASQTISSETFLYLAWERQPNPLGSANVDFELDQNASQGDFTQPGNYTINRTEGDILITYDFGGSGTPDLGLLTWLTAGNGHTNSDCEASGQKLPCWGDRIDLNPTSNPPAESAVNSTTIDEAFTGGQLDAGSFGEAKIDLSAVPGLFTGGTCKAFGNMFVKSRSSGSSIDAELKDFIAPQPIQVSNCASPEVATQTSVATMNVGQTETVGDAATLTGGNNPTGDVSFQLYSDANCQDAVAGVSGSAPLNSSGVATFTGASFTPTQAGTFFWGVSYAGDNNNNGVSACGGDNEEIVVNAADVSITKTADHTSPVNAGDQIGFTVEVKNTGLGDATGVTLDDSLSAGSGTGVTWTVDNSVGTPASFVLGGSPGHQTLSLASSMLPAGADYIVHIVAQTSATECGTYDNTATLSTGNANDPNPASAEEDCNPAQIHIVKTADAAQVNAGDQIGFTLTVYNAGAGDAKGVTLTDTLPVKAGLSWSIASQGAGWNNSCAINAGVLTCGPVTVPGGTSQAASTFTVHIISPTTGDTGGVCPGGSGVITNTGDVTTTNDGTDESSDSTCVAAPAIHIVKTADAAQVNAGDPIGFTLTVYNDGSGDANGVTLTDTLPVMAGLAWSIADQGLGWAGTCGINAGVLTCGPVTVPAGTSQVGSTFTVHITSPTTADTGGVCPDGSGVITNTGHVSTTNDGSDESSASTCVAAAAVHIVKTADAAQVNAGDPIGFTLTVYNDGSGDANNVTLSDTLPTNVGLSWSIDSQGAGWNNSCAIGAGALSCGPVTVLAGTTQAASTFTVHITSPTTADTGGVCPGGSGVVNNTGAVTSSNAGSDDSSASTCVAAPSVSITKTADHGAPVLAGSQIGFTVEVKNTGSGDATGVSLSDPLPAGSGTGVTWAIDTAVGTPGQFVLSGPKGSQTLSLDASTLPSGADYTVHITATTSATECGTYANSATLTTGNANNPNPASAAEACHVPQIDLAVTKAGSPASQKLGAGNITWTMVVTNNGPDTATGVTAADPLPAGNTFVSVSTTKGSCTAGAIVSCSIGTMTAGESVTITLVTTPTAPGTVTNTVTVVGNEHETNTANNTATATVQVNQETPPPPVFCVAVSKVLPKQLFVGRKTTLTIHLTKHGTAVKGVRVRIKGPKLDIRTAASNSKGVITKQVKMKKAGILIFSPIASKRCNTKRVGVTGVFTPPVTG